MSNSILLLLLLQLTWRPRGGGVAGRDRHGGDLGGGLGGGAGETSCLFASVELGVSVVKVVLL